MRSLLFNAEPQTRFPSSPYEELPDFSSPMADGLHSFWLPNAIEPRMSYNAFHLSSKASTSDFSMSYYRRRLQSAAAPAGLTVPTGSGGNIVTTFGNAFGYSNEQAGLSVGLLGYCPIYNGNGTNMTISVCTWFRINRVNGSGFPSLLGNSYTSTWWLGLRTSNGKYKAIFRNNTSPYGPFEWGSYGADLRKVVCVAFVLPCDANKTASVYHNGVLAVQGTLANASGVAGTLNVLPLSSATPGMFAEIFGFAAWTRALYPEEIRELASGPWALLAKRQRFWYAPLMAQRGAEIAGESALDTVRFLGTTRAAEIAGTGSLAVQRMPASTADRTWRIRAENRAFSPAAESRTLTVRREHRGIEA